VFKSTINRLNKYCVLMMWNVKVTSAPSSLVKVTVQRTASAAMGQGSTLSSNQPTSRLSRQASDVSDVSTTTPVTQSPAVRDTKLHPLHRRRHRQDNDSSSCSSTEALHQPTDDAWKENAAYEDQRRQRKPTRNQTPHIVDVDTQPLDDLLTETQQPRPSFTKSSVELDRPASPPHSSVSAAPFQLAMSVFKSMPDVSAVRVIQDPAKPSELDGCNSSMIDCISVAAPDDTVVKPSQLRASMRQRQTPSIVDDFDKPDASSDNAPRRGGSLRVTKQESASDRGTGSVRSKNIVSVTSTSTDDGISCRSSVLSSSSSPGLPSFPRTPPLSRTHEDNGVEGLSYDQLMHKFKEVRNIGT